MNLKQKLLTTFGGLALLTIATSGMSLWTFLQWQSSNARMQEHYQRSLLVKRIQGTTLGAFREIHDGVIGQDSDAQQEFTELLRSVAPDFQRWDSLAHNDQERQQIQEIRQAYEQLVQQANEVFTLARSGQRSRAIVLLDKQLEEAVLNRFQTVTEQAIASDDQNRAILAQVDQTRRTAQIALSISAIATISLALLLAAYLSSDLFSPLQDLQQALADLNRGDLQRRLDPERPDEFGEVNRVFNQLAETIAYREQAVSIAVNSDSIPLLEPNQLPSRVLLHQLLSQLRSRMDQLTQNTSENHQAVTAQLEVLLQAVTRIAEFGFPLDLNLARTDVRLLMYEVVQRHQAEMMQRAISLELDLDPELTVAVVDRLKLRSALSELIQNSLSALPEQGGRIGIRAYRTQDKTHLNIEIADTGKGLQEPLVETVFEPWQSGSEDKAGVGLSLTQTIIQQHGGQITLDSLPGQGTYISICLPLGA